MKLVHRELIDELSRQEYRKHYQGTRTQEMVGALETVRLLDKRELVFRQRVYRVPPVPFDLAARMLDLRVKLSAMQPNAPLTEALELYEEAARLSQMACRPAGLVRRALWRLLPNPFRKATPWEVGRNLAFFSMCLALDREPQMWEPVRRGLGTSSPTWPGSRNGSRRGPMRVASRSRGATS